MFILDPTIESNSDFVCKLSLCEVRLQNDSRYPWVVLIPRVSDVTEVYQLSQQDQNQLILESSVVSEVLNRVVINDKINVANIGNIVSQLHWHVVARRTTDEAWPGPIWGVGKAISYKPTVKQDLIKKLKHELINI